MFVSITGCLSIRRSPSEPLQERLLCNYPHTGSPDEELLARCVSYQMYLDRFDGSWIHTSRKTDIADNNIHFRRAAIKVALEIGDDCATSHPPHWNLCLNSTHYRVRFTDETRTDSCSDLSSRQVPPGTFLWISTPSAAKCRSL